MSRHRVSIRFVASVALLVCVTCVGGGGETEGDAPGLRELRAPRWRHAQGRRPRVPVPLVQYPQPALRRGRHAFRAGHAVPPAGCLRDRRRPGEHRADGRAGRPHVRAFREEAGRPAGLAAAYSGPGPVQRGGVRRARPGHRGGPSPSRAGDHPVHRPVELVGRHDRVGRISRQEAGGILDRSAGDRGLQRYRCLRHQSAEHRHGRALPRRQGDLSLGDRQRAALSRPNGPGRSPHTSRAWIRSTWSSMARIARCCCRLRWRIPASISSRPTITRRIRAR